MNFVWKMTESNWESLIDTQKGVGTTDYFGSCYVGGVCFDFQHTLDKADWYPYTNCFYVKENSGYGRLDDGTDYDLADDTPAIPIKCKTFGSFKKRCEELFEKYINNHSQLEALVNMETKWNCC